MEIDLVAIRKLIAGVLAILLATGIIKWDFIQKNKVIKYTTLVIGILFVASTLLYQFDIIPESSTDALLKGK